MVNSYMLNILFHPLVPVACHVIEIVLHILSTFTDTCVLTVALLCVLILEVLLKTWYSSQFYCF
jgi:hypothetical protein